jgi:hypothetical protein
MVSSKLVLALLLVFSLFLMSEGASVSSDASSGSFSFMVNGYNVKGDLTNAAIAHGGLVQMLMSIDQSISTSYGVVHITGSGVWSGETDYQTFNGSIGNVIGTVQACVVFYCQTANFAGSGTWTGAVTSGSIAGSQGSGTFGGTLTFTGQNVNQTGPVPVSGNWTATFQS